MTARVEWCSRSLLYSPYYYCLCISEASFQCELRRLKIKKEMRPDYLASDTANATTHFFCRNNETHIAIVTLGSVKGRTAEEVNGLLVHEATHIWQAIRGNIGETAPSSEFEAYAMQAIAQELMESYRKQRKKRTKAA